MKTIQITLAVALLFACSGAPNQRVPQDVEVVTQALSDYAITATVIDNPAAGLTRTKHTVQQGTDPLNVFGVTRVKSSYSHKPVILHGPFGYDYRWYELTETTNYRKSFLGSLATLGFDVWVIDDRLSKQAPGTCEVTGCLAMGDWTVQTRVDDAEFVRGLVLGAYGLNQKVVIGGYVGGAMFAQATVNAFPDHYAGLFLWEGSMVADSAQQAFSAPNCGLLQFVTSLGIYSDPTPQIFALLFQLKQADPTGISPVPGIPGLEFLAAKLAELGIVNATNDQVFYVVSTQHLNNPNWPTPSFHFLAGDSTGVDFASEPRYLKIGGIVDAYASLTTIRDITCGLAGDTTYTDNLAAFEGKVLALGAHGGFGAELEFTEAAYENADYDVFVNEDFGESDRFFNPHRFLLADVPFAIWASTVF